jgi:tetratricopeptide (TPR) repeat protein
MEWKMNKNIFIASALIIILGGCAAVGVPTTNDPIEKLKWATDLYNNQGRPLPAENLIQEAITICESTNNQSCLGKAYSEYGFFLRAPSVRANEAAYRKYGFLDKSVNFDNRLLKSKEKFEASIKYYLATNEYDSLTAAYLNLGFAYYFLNEQTNECAPYSKSLEYNQKNIEANPNAKVVTPNGFSSFSDYVKFQQNRAGCI